MADQHQDPLPAAAQDDPGFPPAADQEDKVPPVKKARVIRIAQRKPSREEPTQASAKPASSRYGLMYYRRQHSTAVRVKGGGKQVLCFGGQKARHLTQAQLEEFGNTAISKLEAGGTPEEVKAWCQQEIAR